MALEDELKALTAAVKELTAETKDLKALRADAIQQTREAAVSTKAPTAAKAEKPAAATTTTVPETTGAEAGAVDDATAKSYDEAKGIMEGYIKGTEREEERAARMTKVRELLRHPKIVKPEVLTNPPMKASGTEAFSVQDIKPESVGVLLKNLKKLVETGDLTTPPAAAATEAPEEDLL